MAHFRAVRRWLVGGALLLLLVALPLAQTNAAPLQQGGDFEIPGGRFFPQTANGQGGFSVVNNNEARFWTEYQRLGGSQTVGFPISRRFVYDGFVTQAFQKLVLQWRPEVGIAYPLNVFDELSEAGHNEVLFRTRQTPYPLQNFDQPGWTWQQIVANRQALLSANPALRARYFSVGDPLNVFGLPTSRVEDMGNHFAIRTQRAVFQQWKEAVPWASAGQVTIANGGSIAHELGWLPAEATTPEPFPGSPSPTAVPTAASVTGWEPQRLLVGSEGTLLLLQMRQRNGNVPEHRIMGSANGGASWNTTAFGTLPGADCLYDLTMDYTTPNIVYLSTCEGVFRWDGARWNRVMDSAYGLALEYGDPQTLWAIRPKENGGAQLSRSDDGGATWRRLGQFALGASQLGIDPSTHRVLYALRTEYGSTGGAKLVRMDSEVENSATLLNVGFEPNIYDRRPTALTIDGANGDVYVATDWNGEVPVRVWHSTNADDPDVSRVYWEVQSEPFGATMNTIVHLAGGRDGSDRFVLYAIYVNYPLPASGNGYSLIQSYDGGQTWQPITVPR